MTIVDQVVEMAVIQHGVFATWQLKELGIKPNSISSVVRKDIFVRLKRGVYQLLGTPLTWHTNALASVLEHGNSARLSHESALINLELLPYEFISKRKGQVIDFHVTKPRITSTRQENLHRSIYKETFVANIQNSIPQVTADHALIESAHHLPPSFFSGVVDQAFRNNLVSCNSLRNALEALWPAPGRSKSRVIELLKFYEKNIHESESILETKVLQILSEFEGLIFTTQHPIQVGNKKYRLDIAVPSKKLAIEVDGFKFHRTRDQFDSDRSRQNDIVLLGWKIIRITNSFSAEEIRSIILNALS